jgi:hemerythrin-like domain-containing protein
VTPLVSPLDTLEAEHRVIAKIILVASMLADRLFADQSVDVEILKQMAEFMRIYADKCHHGKEEQLLFPLLVKRGVPARGCQIDVLTREHVMGRDLVIELSETSLAYQKYGSLAKDALIKNLRGIADLYTNHIWKENYLLFPMTNTVLGLEDLNALSRDFEKVEQDIGREAQASLARFADGLYASLT